MANLFSLNIETLTAEHRAKIARTLLQYLSAPGQRAIWITARLESPPAQLFECRLIRVGVETTGHGATKEEALAQALHAWTLNGSK